MVTDGSVASVDSVVTVDSDCSVVTTASKSAHCVFLFLLPKPGLLTIFILVEIKKLLKYESLLNLNVRCIKKLNLQMMTAICVALLYSLQQYSTTSQIISQLLWSTQLMSGEVVAHSPFLCE